MDSLRITASPGPLLTAHYSFPSLGKGNQKQQPRVEIFPQRVSCVNPQRSSVRLNFTAESPCSGCSTTIAWRWANKTGYCSDHAAVTPVPSYYSSRLASDGRLRVGLCLIRPQLRGTHGELCRLR
ncbi:hypothetical protein MRX96_010377 [Rhipicephalus microplus]